MSRLPLLLSLAIVNGALFANPVINEIHYNNDLNTVRNEFVELHNPTNADIDLSQWQLTGAIEFTFPAGTSLPLNGYLVVAEDPATIASEFGISALGPYSGNLNSSGERLELDNASGLKIDQVDYGIGFPWPTLAKGKGSSMEFINPALDNDLGSSWRSSSSGFSGAQQTFIDAASVWNYRKGLDEASSPIHAWTAHGFTEDATWLTGQTPIGRSEPAFTNTLINDAQNNYRSVFLRKEFNLSGNAPSTLLLKLLYDDGVIVWLNGSEIYRTDSVSTGTVNFQGNDANNNNAVTGHEKDGYEEFIISGTAALLQQGGNTLAVQVFNSSLTSSDILIDATLETPPPFFTQSPPSPGQPNSSATQSTPPNIRQVSHAPVSPSSSDPVTISAKITDSDEISTVTLSYQIVVPGSYVHKDDATFEDGWIDLPMTDPEGNDTFTATIAASTHRHLVRYRITTSDTLGETIRAPFLDDGQPNFAYFVYDGTPSWTGADQPGVSPTETFTPGILNQLATYHLIADATDVQNSQYVSSFKDARFIGTLVHDGVVYDHIEFKVGGTGSTYFAGKNKWRMYFNPARDLHPHDNYGNKYKEGWNKLTMNACASTRVAGNRGIAGIDEALSFRTYQLADTLSPNTSFLHFRVIDELVETSPTDQYTGDLWGIYLAIEEIDGGLLDERDLTDGNLYKIEGNALEHQSKDQPSNNSDWSSFTSGSNSTNTEAWWRSNLDLEKYFSFRTCNRIVGNVDLRFGGNHRFYHGTSSDGTQSRWVPIPWDLDMMYIAMGHQSGTIRQQNCLNHSAIALEFRNRSREILDLLLTDPTSDGGQIGQLTDEFGQFVNPTGDALTWADLDRFMWNFNPRTGSSGSPKFDHFGNFNSTPTSESRIGGSWTRTFDSPDFEGTLKFLLDYMSDVDPDPSTWSKNSGDQRGYGYNFVASESADSSIPDTPTISYTGTAGFPTTGLSFESSPFSDPQGNGTFAAMEWRIGEIDSTPGLPRIYEIEENWTSEELATFNADLVPPALATKPGNTYRARVRHQDSSGRWSHWSAPLEFIASGPDLVALQRDLVISEIMYNPSTGQEHEYIELFNQGNDPLDLTGVRFTKGIDFDFPDGTTIAAGAYLLVVKDPVAFAAFYGAGLPVAGEYGTSTSASLSNSGELVKLALGTVAIHEFEYNDSFPWPSSPDGDGFALVLSHTSNNTVDDPLGHGLASNWRQGEAGGTPGVADPTSTLSGSFDDDTDNDGQNALLEHALGSSDSTPNGSPISISIANGLASLTFPKNPLADDVRYFVETSLDLQTWITDATLTSETPLSATYSRAVPQSSSKLFMRLRVEQVPPIPQ